MLRPSMRHKVLWSRSPAQALMCATQHADSVKVVWFAINSVPIYKRNRIFSNRCALAASDEAFSARFLPISIFISS
jgi:hypothetical protein